MRPLGGHGWYWMLLCWLRWRWRWGSGGGNGWVNGRLTPPSPTVCLGKLCWRRGRRPRMGCGAETAPAGFGLFGRFSFCRSINLIRGVRHRPGRVSDCSRNGTANTNHPSPPFLFALSLVELLKSIVAADGGLMKLGAGDSVSSSPAYGLCVLLRPCFYQKCPIRPGERSGASTAGGCRVRPDPVYRIE